ncbi:ATPase involved in chromosome partitioning [Bradyrhizobium sp. YR681]|uniref:ParA family protein n=1 Tax=Bradyrhizobium sp. YR681 TaxID=1144344 RepID=UPI000270EE11|nr:ParA family protein [Bradyrhizobium sp. YR681]EJN16273.1 ATPase involved in chromosome partitioning [Bradyrhizobium sp. YR681]
MKIVSFVNQKGGTGKSMLAINLAVAAEAAGEKACLIDLDPQGTVTNWFDTRTAETPPVVAHESAADLTKTLTALEQAGFSLVVIDTKGEDGHATRAAMRVADLCLIPVRPAGPDLHATRTTMEALHTMRRDFALVVNQATPNKAAKLTSAVMTGLAQSGPVVPISLASRMDFQYSYALGLGVSEHAPESKAADEVAEFWAWCRKRINKEKTGEQQERRRA